MKSNLLYTGLTFGGFQLLVPEYNLCLEDAEWRLFNYQRSGCVAVIAAEAVEFIRE